MFLLVEGYFESDATQAPEKMLINSEDIRFIREVEEVGVEVEFITTQERFIITSQAFGSLVDELSRS